MHGMDARFAEVRKAPHGKIRIVHTDPRDHEEVPWLDCESVEAARTEFGNMMAAKRAVMTGYNDRGEPVDLYG